MCFEPGTEASLSLLLPHLGRPGVEKKVCVSMATFRHLCTKCNRQLQYASTMCAAICVETRVAITLWQLGTWSTGSFHISLELEFQQLVYVHDVCRAIVDVLLKRYGTWQKKVSLLWVRCGYEYGRT